MSNVPAKVIVELEPLMAELKKLGAGGTMVVAITVSQDADGGANYAILSNVLPAQAMSILDEAVTNIDYPGDFAQPH